MSEQNITERSPVLAAPVFAARIGIDWADKKHFWTILSGGGQTERGQLDHTPEAIEAWAAGLAQRFLSQPVAVALEQSRGPLIAMLLKYAHLHLYPIHPNNLNNYRKSVYPSGAKSDLRDADLILEYLVKHADRLRVLVPDTVETRTLQLLVEERRRMVDEHTSQVQILTHWVKQSFPQFLRWFDDVAAPVALELLKNWPTLAELGKVSDKKLRQFFHAHNCRSEEKIVERLKGIREAVNAVDDPALMKVATLSILASINVLLQYQAGIAGFDSEIAILYKAHPDRLIVESFPGAGPALEPRLIAAVGSIRERFASAADMASFVGIAPVTESSGNSLWIHWRWACPKFVRQTFHEWAACSIRTCEWAREHYDKRRAKAKTHHAAVRSVAFKWIRIFFRCWRDRVPYSEQLYIQSRQARVVASASADKPAPKKLTGGQKQRSSKAVTVQWKKVGGFSKAIVIIA